MRIRNIVAGFGFSFCMMLSLQCPVYAMEEANEIGRLVVPDVGVNVSIWNTAGLSPKDKQYFVDLPDSAAWWAGPTISVIADHNYQGFSRTENVVSGETLASIVCGAIRIDYICSEMGTGMNTGCHLIGDDGKDLCCYSSWNDGSFITYTCHGDEPGIFYTVWKPIK